MSELLSHNRYTIAQHNALLPKIRIAFVHNYGKTNAIDAMVKLLHIKDSELVSRFVFDEKNPDYVIATDQALINRDLCARLKYYISCYKDSIFVFYAYECVEANLNIFDYVVTMNSNLQCCDRIVKNPFYLLAHMRFQENTLTREEARRLLESRSKFCNFIYSHEQEPRDTFFHMLSRYKRVDSLGRNLNNTNTESTRRRDDWYNISLELKLPYKFSITMENAVYKGYTTEKIISSLQAHTVPIYWGDPEVCELFNPKAFINCADYDSFDEVIERVKEIDNDDEQYIDMITQPWQTEEQRAKTLEIINNYDKFIHNIFYQDIKKARRRPVGAWADHCRNGFTGIVGIMPTKGIRIWLKIRQFIGSLFPLRYKLALKKLLHLYG